jgi:hypothetical protein
MENIVGHYTPKKGLLMVRMLKVDEQIFSILGHNSTPGGYNDKKPA